MTTKEKVIRYLLAVLTAAAPLIGIWDALATAL